MRARFLATALAVAVSSLALPGVASATLTIGDSLQLQYHFDSFGDVIDDTGVFVYTGPGQSLPIQFGFTTVTLYDNYVVFAEFPGCGDGCTQNPADWNGPVLYDYTNVNAFAGWKVLSDTVGITSSLLTGGAIGVNWQGAPVQGEVLVGAVPEPSTWAMMLVGLGAAGAMARRRVGSDKA